MKIRLFFAILTTTLTAGVAASQTTATKAFNTAPHEVIKLIDAMTRLDMIDYYNAGSNTASTIIYDEGGSITDLTDSKITFTLSDKVTQSLYVLPAKGDTIIASVKTYRLPAVDSSIEFYDSQWNPIEISRVIDLPVIDLWLQKPTKESREAFNRVVPFVPMEITINPETGTLTVTNDLAALLPREAMAELTDIVRPSVNYTWDSAKGKFKLAKQ
ncbi:MAG: DUF3256 family protein [Muribaculaceae bacterium]|nr:DUF3256 family protein [Muribaculaceae bacterium]